MKYSNKINDIKEFLNSVEFRGELVDAKICTQIALDLRNLRESQNITQAQLAEQLGINQSHIARWERPGYQGYKVKMLSKIVRILNGTLSVNIFTPRQRSNFTINSTENKSVISYAYINNPYENISSKYSVTKGVV